METIIDYRAYGRAKAAYDARGRRTYEPPLTDVVLENDFALVQEGRRP